MQGFAVFAKADSQPNFRDLIKKLGSLEFKERMQNPN